MVFSFFLSLASGGSRVMVEFKLSDIKNTTPLELVIRFVFGGVCTAAAGLIAKRYGPGIGGLFLAFPAIFPAGVTLIQAHEKKKKARIGSDGTHRGRLAASIDSAGAALGCFGLLAFALTCWKGLPNHNVVAIIAFSVAIWFVTSVALWGIRKRRIFGRGETTPKQIR
jgi:Protein of unknown function (DUF3147)